MERKEAIERLAMLAGQDLRVLAAQHGVTVFRDGRLNKGWAGHVVERCLGLAQNSSRSPNFGSWELKVVPVRLTIGGELRFKDTMAITMLDPTEVALKEFDDSHLFNKLRKALIVARVFVDRVESSSVIHSLAEFDLDDSELREQIRTDYDLIRTVVRERGSVALSGRMGVLIQPRTKGPGHGSVSRAFYARKLLLEQVFARHRLDMPS